MEKVKSISSKVKKSDKETTVSIEEIENGFLIIRSTNWNDEKKGYQYETKKYFSKDNPLDSTDKPLSDIFSK